MTTHQSKLAQLISDLCPSGVEFLEVGKVMRRHKGTKITATQMKVLHKNGASVKIFAGGKTYAQVDFSDIPKNDIYQIPSVIVKSRGVIEFEYYDKPFTHKNEFWSYFSDNDNINIKFVFYYLKEKEPYFQKLASKMQMPQISLPDTQKFKIPLPPLPIQQEIVKILDTFTHLEAELEAELEARRGQYNYYRDSLMKLGNFKSHVYRIGELARNLDSRRKPVTKSARKLGEYPYYGASGIVDYVNDYIFDGNYLLISEDGANLLARSTPIAFQTKGKVWVNNHAHILEFENKITQRFVEIYINSIDLSMYISGAAQPKLNQENLNKIEIPLPSIAEQTRIVSILDKFDALVNDISIGLPAELAARRRQYEYYRDTLLTFKERTTPLP